MRHPHSPTSHRPAVHTSWERVAGWYKGHLQQEDFLQKDVVIPGVLALLTDAPLDAPHLDVACGEGTFARAFIRAFPRRRYTGIDASPSLIRAAQNKHLPKSEFLVDDAQQLKRLPSEARFGSASCILAIQNIEQPDRVFRAVARRLAPRGSFVLVLNHPCFRQPRQSGWGWDEERKIQYRRVDRYLGSYDMPIIAHPGKQPDVTTTSFHRPVRDYLRAAIDAGFMIDGYDEWTSPAKSNSGPRAKAENIARVEIPLFLAIRCRLAK